MKHSLINQILVENTTVQGLHVGQGSKPLLSAYQRIQKLVRELRRANPASKNYCLASTILIIGSQTEAPTLRQQVSSTTAQRPSQSHYVLSFERLQYQAHLASSLLA